MNLQFSLAIPLIYLRYMNRSLLAVFFLLFASMLQAQRNVKDSTIVAPHMAITYGYLLNGGDMADRFDPFHSIGADFYVKTKKNWFLGGEGSFLVTNTVMEPGLISNLVTDKGELIDQDGQLSVIDVTGRGWKVTVNGGKLFPVFGSNPNSGLLLRGGVGFLQHKIRIEHQINTLPQLDGDYEKGYDRLTNGLLLNQFVGWYHMSNNRIANFIVGIDAYQGFTQGRRDWNFDTQMKDDQPRLDVMLGLKVGWIIHFYPRTGPEFYTD